MQVFITSLVSELTHQWINPGHHHVNRGFENPYFISIHRRDSELEMLVYVVVMKEFTDNLS